MFVTGGCLNQHEDVLLLHRSGYKQAGGRRHVCFLPGSLEFNFQAMQAYLIHIHDHGSHICKLENVLTFDNNILLMDHLSASSKFCTSSCPTVDAFQHSYHLQLTSRAAEINQWVVNADCSTSYAIVGQHVASNQMFLDILAPGHTTTPNQITSVNADAGDDFAKIMQLLNSDELRFEDFPYREPGQANYSAAETSATQFHGLQHGERMDLSQNHFTHLMNSENVQSIIIEDGTNVNQQRQMNNVLMVPVASTCKGKYKKSWTKISSILKWLVLKRFVDLKEVHTNRKRKFSK